MGRTLWGIDLDESPLGGLIESLLDEEDLAKLDARPDGGTERDSGETADAERDAGEGGDGSADRDSESSESPSPTVDEAEASDSSDHEGGRIPSLGTDDSEDSGRLGALRPRLRKAGLALAGLAVLAAVLGLVVWRYGDRMKGALPSRFRRGGEGTADEGTGEGHGTGVREETMPWESDAEPSEQGGTDETESAVESEQSESAAVETGADTDLGAVVALAFLALVAALVREFARRRDEDAPFDED